ncbi:unnamed protein product [Lepeophtheirus salmonis]|uniref:(salmon louse) hypothetical protein n=1 Tax=Lepeophtheirus salmonis TaxID=72036 RepID=A0A7R8CRP8_LEPSM|nr:unnamed protein product [Lepeophtheirus salmonis]CAF2907604.1 unnamed protein product [Lepeophtheirus salmonis]
MIIRHVMMMPFGQFRHGIEYKGRKGIGRLNKNPTGRDFFPNYAKLHEQVIKYYMGSDKIIVNDSQAKKLLNFHALRESELLWKSNFFFHSWSGVELQVKMNSMQILREHMLLMGISNPVTKGLIHLQQDRLAWAMFNSNETAKDFYTEEKDLQASIQTKSMTKFPTKVSTRVITNSDRTHLSELLNRDEKDTLSPWRSPWLCRTSKNSGLSGFILSGVGSSTKAESETSSISSMITETSKSRKVGPKRPKLQWSNHCIPPFLLSKGGMKEMLFLGIPPLARRMTQKKEGYLTGLSSSLWYIVSETSNSNNLNLSDLQKVVLEMVDSEEALQGKDLGRPTVLVRDHLPACRFDPSKDDLNAAECTPTEPKSPQSSPLPAFANSFVIPVRRHVMVMLLENSVIVSGPKSIDRQNKNPFRRDFFPNYAKLHEKVIKCKFCAFIHRPLRSMCPSVGALYRKCGFSNHFVSCCTFGQAECVKWIAILGHSFSIHLYHRGVLNMKVVNRTKIRWAGMDGEISNFVTACIMCKTTASSPLALFKSKSRPSKGSILHLVSNLSHHRGYMRRRLFNQQ